MTCFDCLRSKECTKQEKIMLTVDGIGEYVYQRNVEKDCPNFLDGDAALDLINRLQAENERKDKILNSYALQYGTVKDRSKMIEEIKSAAQKEFAESIKSKLRDLAKIDHRGEYCYLIGEAFFDNLLLELDGKENGSEMQSTES